jgi:GT2 family glycosyltransferase
VTVDLDSPVTTSPLVSIVIVTLNNRSFVAECLSCAIGQDYPRIEVIVVDQNSTDGTAELVARDFPGIQLQRNTANTGFAEGMNQGIELAAGDYVLLLNSDVFLDVAFISQAVTQFQRVEPERAGMLATLLYRHEGGLRTRRVDSAGAMLVPYHTAVNCDRIDADAWVATPGGAAMFVSRLMLDDIRLPAGDYLDSSYFCYGDDVEFALRAQLLGWRCRYTPIVAGWHMGGASANGQWRYSDKPAALLIHAIKNRYLTLLSCYPLGLLLTTLPWHVLTEVGQLLSPFVRLRRHQLTCLLRAYLLVLRMLPQTLAKRAWVQRRRRVSCAYLRSLYVDWGIVRTLESLWQKA